VGTCVAGMFVLVLQPGWTTSALHLVMMQLCPVTPNREVATHTMVNTNVTVGTCVAQEPPWYTK